MPTVNSTRSSSTFYVAANIIFDLGTGETKRVLMLVNKPEDATAFAQEDAQNYANFVKIRASNLIWSIEPLRSTSPGLLPWLPKPTDRFIIKGVQYV